MGHIVDTLHVRHEILLDFFGNSSPNTLNNTDTISPKIKELRGHTLTCKPSCNQQNLCDHFNKICNIKPLGYPLVIIINPSCCSYPSMDFPFQNRKNIVSNWTTFLKPYCATPCIMFVHTFSPFLETYNNFFNMLTVFSIIEGTFGNTRHRGNILLPSNMFTKRIELRSHKLFQTWHVCANIASHTGDKVISIQHTLCPW